MERIVGKRTRGGRTEFLVKWKGYDDKGNTWEPKDSIQKEGAQLIEAFEFNSNRRKTKDLPALIKGECYLCGKVHRKSLPFSYHKEQVYRVRS